MKARLERFSIARDQVIPFEVGHRTSSYVCYDDVRRCGSLSLEESVDWARGRLAADNVEGGFSGAICVVVLAVCLTLAIFALLTNGGPILLAVALLLLFAHVIGWIEYRSAAKSLGIACHHLIQDYTKLGTDIDSLVDELGADGFTQHVPSQQVELASEFAVRHRRALRETRR